MSKLITVFGVTGNQGGSVVTQLLNDSSLAKEFKIRGVTRDISKPAAQHLAQKGVEVVTVSRSTKRWAEVMSDANLLLGRSERQSKSSSSSKGLSHRLPHHKLLGKCQPRCREDPRRERYRRGKGSRRSAPHLLVPVGRQRHNQRPSCQRTSLRHQG
jgi:hypothetical protein